MHWDNFWRCAHTRRFCEASTWAATSGQERGALCGVRGHGPRRCADVPRERQRDLRGSGSEPPQELSARIEEGLERSLGYEVRDLPAQRRGAQGHRPLPAVHARAGRGLCGEAAGGDALRATATPGARTEVLALASDQDRLAFGARELYWLPSGGISESALDLKAIARHIGSMTLRTRSTVEQIAERHFSD